MGLMRLMPVPTGWVEMDRHLLEWHDLPAVVVADLDADAGRRVHAELHRPGTHLNYGGRPRRHEHA